MYSSNNVATSISTFTAPIKLNASSIFSQINMGSQLNNVLQTYIGDLSSCLANCSNQGICVLSNGQNICECNKYRTGLSCQSDTRPCSSGPCLNNGICSSIKNDTTFECTCQNELFYGKHCENKINLCLNSTICIQNQGYCQMNGTQPICKCFMDYSGAKCEIISTSLIVRKAFTSLATFLAILVLVCFLIMIFCFDFIKYYLMRNMKQFKTKKQIITKKRFSHTLSKIRPRDLP